MAGRLTEEMAPRVARVGLVGNDEGLPLSLSRSGGCLAVAGDPGGCGPPALPDHVYPSQRMKIVYVLDSLTPGGTEVSTVTLASGLVAGGDECHIITLKDAPHSLAETAERNGVSTERLAPGSFVAQVRALRSRLRELSPEVVHTALFRADQVGRVAAVGLDVRLVSGLVGTPYDPARLTDPNLNRWKLGAVRLLDSLTGRFFVDAFAAVSPGVRAANASALHLPIDRIEVVERGRDPKRFRPLSRERRAEVRASLGVDDGACVVINVGRLDHHKSQLTLLRAAGMFRTTIDRPAVLIVGKDGNASAEVRSELERQDLGEIVHLLGHRGDVNEILGAANVLVISSSVEGTAGVALEAMAVTTPVVSTDLEGLRGVLRNEENALLVPVGDPAALAEAVERVIRDRVLREGLVETAARDFCDHYTLDAATARLRGFYSRQISR